MPFDEELILLVARNDFLKEKPEVVRAFLSDLKQVTAYYLANRAKARQALIDARMILTPPDVYLNMQDYYRDPDLKVDIGLLKQAQDLHMKMGMSEKPADIDAAVDLSYLPEGK
ncbi:hypothetical protein D9M70_640670 [compost metagenome]